MNHAHFSPQLNSNYQSAMLVNQINLEAIQRVYKDLCTDQVLVLSLHQSVDKKKTPVIEIKEYITHELVPVLKDFSVSYLLVADGEYFKALTGVSKVDQYVGYVLPSKTGSFHCIYLPNYQQHFYNPDRVNAVTEAATHAYKSHLLGVYSPPGTGIIQGAYYPKSYKEIEQALEDLLKRDVPLAIDCETFSLKHYDSGIGTIAFAWDKHNGIAFPVDYRPDGDGGVFHKNEPVRELLRKFFLRYSQKAIYHNIAFDGYILIYNLFMDHLIDTEGLLKGMNILLNNWECTKLISYLATNSCAGNDLSLKAQAQEFAGNYGLGDDIKDITKIPLDTLLEYNLVDTLSTWYTYEKNYPVMVQDQQLNIYETLFKPATLDVIQMQLTGMPLDMKRVEEVEKILTKDALDAQDRIRNNQPVMMYEEHRMNAWVDLKNTTLKKKRVTQDDAKALLGKKNDPITFNPNSGNQLQELLFTRLQLPVLALTDSKQPSTDGDTLKNLKNHTQDPEIIGLLDALLDWASVDKILSSFLPVMLSAPQAPDGWHYLYGNFNLGGTVSGRLSSSKPNLQNQPANSKYAKYIKSCFSAPEGWLFVGLDFDALEDRISALTTRDPNKLKVYIGHIIYEVCVDGTIHHIRDDAIINFDGKSYTGEEFYDTFGPL